MVISCSAISCTNRHGKVADEQKLLFHSFPLKNPELLTHWLKAVKRKDWKPTKYSVLCSAHFLNEDYRYGKEKKKRLLPNAVPSIFDTPWSVRKQNPKQILPKKLLTVPVYVKIPNDVGFMTADPASRVLSSTSFVLVPAGNHLVEHSYALSDAQKHYTEPNSTIDQDPLALPIAILSENEYIYNQPVSRKLPSTADKSTQTTKYPSTRELLLRKKIRALRKRNFRLRRRMRNMRDVVKKLKRHSLGNRQLHEGLDKNLFGLPISSLLKSGLIIRFKKTGRRYSKEFKHFAVTLYFYSPNAYRFVGKHIDLPRKSMITKWVSAIYSVPVESGEQNSFPGAVSCGEGENTLLVEIHETNKTAVGTREQEGGVDLCEGGGRASSGEVQPGTVEERTQKISPEAFEEDAYMPKA